MTQSQKAGSGSQQVQIMGDYVVQGVTEERAAQIAQQQARQVLDEYTNEAAPLAQERIQKLEGRLIHVLSSDGTLDALKDPAFQVLLRKAQLGAASTEREGDYDLLARLLSQRANQNTRFVRASVDKAVQVVDSIDESALQGLNMLWVISAFTPGGYSLQSTIDSMQGLIRQFPYDKLPFRRRWLDHLDMIDLVRVAPDGLSSLKKFGELLAARTPGIISLGMDEDALTQMKAAWLKLTSRDLPIVGHELKEGFSRIAFRSADLMRSQLLKEGFSETDTDALVAIAQSIGNVDQVDEALVPQLEAAIVADPVLSVVSTWWDQIPNYPHPTSAGITVAYANSLRYTKFENVDGLDSYLEDFT